MALIYIFILIFGVNATAERIRFPAVSGTFYPEEPGVLAGTVKDFLDRVPFWNRTFPKSVVLYAPHAGYNFSGRTAATAYAQLRGEDFDHIVLLGPSHKGLAPLSVFWKGKGSAWETPLGRTPIDPFAEILANALNGKENPFEVHKEEHALEVQLPFIQALFGNKPIIPILVNDFDASDALLTELLRYFSEHRVLYIISTDLSHYLSAHNGEKKDRNTLDLMKNLSSLDIKKFLKRDHNRMCGDIAAYTGMKIQEHLGLPPVMWTGYAQSSDTHEGTKDRVVGYGAGITYMQPELFSPFYKDLFLLYARKSLEDSFIGDVSLPMADILPKKGVFITLRMGGELRGCVGAIETNLPLLEAIQFYAKEAAFHDTRFSPLTEEELPYVQIEVSLLSPSYPVVSYQGIVPDQDGAIVSHKEKKGVFLPEVWKDMNRTSFFQELCAQKADLPLTCYKNPSVSFEGFQAQVFSES